MMNKSLTFSGRLKNLRTQLGWSQKRLATELGVSENYVGMLEGGREPGSSLERLFGLIESRHTLRQEAAPPHLAMRAARLAKGLSFADLAKLTRYNAGVLQAVEEGQGQASEKMIEAICRALHLEKDALMSGSDEPVVREATNGTYGAKPPVVAAPGVGTPRYVPLISMAQAGTLSGNNFTDGGYTHEGALAFDVTDHRAFALTIRGDSMAPQYTEGDVAVVYPSWTPRSGDLVIARLTEAAGGDVLFKIYTPRDSGRRVMLTSYNAAYPAMELTREELAWCYPVVAVTKTLRR